MLEHSYFSDFDDNDVIAFSDVNLNKSKLLKDVMSKFCQEHLESTITNYVKSNSIAYPNKTTIGRKKIDEDKEVDVTHSNNWTQDGVHCEVLKLGAKEWQKGKIKVRISVEFYPDEPETIHEPPSPLDDIRQSMS